MKSISLTRVRVTVVLTCIVALVSAGIDQIYAATYYVGPDGTLEGDGTREKPFSRTQVQKNRNIKPGDEVIFLDGVYTVGDFFQRKSLPRKSECVLRLGNFKGTYNKPIVFRAENRHKAIFDGSVPVTNWKKVKGKDPVWECELPFAPIGLLVNSEAFVGYTRDKDFAEGRWRVLKREDGKGVRVQVWPWEGKEPKEAYACCLDCIVHSGDYVVLDGFLIRRGVNGIGMGGRHQVYRNLIIRDMVGQGTAGGGRGFNLIEDCVFYNIGASQGDHGIYASGRSHRLTVRRNVWWRISGGAIHAYSGGEGIDEPARITVEYNIIGPDKLGRCWPRLLENRKSTGIYIWGGKRWAGYNRVCNNIIFGGHSRGISQNKSHFNLIANNVIVDCDEYAILLAKGMGNLVVNNIMEPGRLGYYDWWAAQQRLQSGHNLFLPAPDQVKHKRWAINSNEKNNTSEPFTNVAAIHEAHCNLEQGSLYTDKDPFIDRSAFDFRLKPGSKAIDMGEKLHNLSANMKGKGPDAGALEFGETMYGDKGKFPIIPEWLLKEWPLSKRKEQEKHLK